jgi:hypothetical protein
LIAALRASTRFAGHNRVSVTKVGKSPFRAQRGIQPRPQCLPDRRIARRKRAWMSRYAPHDDTPHDFDGHPHNLFANALGRRNAPGFADSSFASLRLSVFARGMSNSVYSERARRVKCSPRSRFLTAPDKAIWGNGLTKVHEAVAVGVQLVAAAVGRVPRERAGGEGGGKRVVHLRRIDITNQGALATRIPPLHWRRTCASDATLRVCVSGGHQHPA